MRGATKGLLGCAAVQWLVALGWLADALASGDELLPALLFVGAALAMTGSAAIAVRGDRRRDRENRQV